MTAWQRSPERGTVAALSFIVWLTLVCGRAATRWLLAPICLYYAAFAPRARRASAAFLARVLERKPGLRDLLRHEFAFASTLHDRIFFVCGRDAGLELVVHGKPELDRAFAAGRGCILVGSHLGSFEVMRALSQVHGRSLNVVMHEANARRMRAMLERLAPRLQERVIAAGSPETMLRVRDCLERGEAVGFLADRLVGGERSATRDFLGSPAAFPLGPWLLAASLGAPVVLFFGLYRGGKRYDVHFEILTEGERAPRAERIALAERWLAHYVSRLEHYARLAPYNWFNFYDFWHAAAR